eukprot:362854-Chlamydomonas_euryale.AAC.3
MHVSDEGIGSKGIDPITVAWALSLVGMASWWWPSWLPKAVAPLSMVHKCLPADSFPRSRSRRKLESWSLPCVRHISADVQAKGVVARAVRAMKLDKHRLRRANLNPPSNCSNWVLSSSTAAYAFHHAGHAMVWHAGVTGCAAGVLRARDNQALD